MSRYFPLTISAESSSGSEIKDARIENDALIIVKKDDSELQFKAPNNFKIAKKKTSEFNTLQKNITTVITDNPSPMVLSFSLEIPSDTEFSEYILIFKATEDTLIVITPPTDYSLNWTSAEPEWENGKVYMIYFKSLEKGKSTKKIIAISAEEV